MTSVFKSRNKPKAAKSGKKKRKSKSGFNFKLKLKKLNKSSSSSASASASAPPVRMIGEWALGETLGMGGYSKVKLGVHRETGVKAALKIMMSDESGQVSESKKKQLIRELNVMKKVHHENVIELIEFDENALYPEMDGRRTPCIVTVLEFASGGELFDYLMFTGCFDEVATRSYFHQMINGLEAMHSLGIAHRDLKPENLLLDEHYVLKIADFGFATEYVDGAGRVQKMKTACGTKGYLAPELLKGKKYTHKCDIFALGIILFTTFAGFPPFQNAVETDWWWDKLSKGWKYIAASEKQKTRKDRDKHIAAGNAKIELFWKAHERTRQFPADLKNLLERMLHPYSEYRYDIRHIRQHPWYAKSSPGSGLYSPAELRNYLQRRVRTVVKERALKIRKQLQEQGQTVSIDGYTVRNTSNGTSAYAKRAAELDPHHDFARCVDHVRDDLFVNTLYQFFTRAAPAEIAARIERVADRSGCKTTISPKNNITLVRCAVAFDDRGGDEDVIFAAKQFLIDDNDYDSGGSTDGEEEDEDEEEENEQEIEEENGNGNGNEIENENENVNVNASASTANSAEEQEAIATTRYLVSFKRLKGSHMAYQKAIESFYSAPEVAQAMSFDEIL